MNVFEFVVAIVFFAFLGKAIKAYFDSKRSANEDRRGEEQDAEASLERLAQLEDRIRTLERIVTDEHVDLNRRFKDL